MTPNDYQQAALRTAPIELSPDRLLLNGLMGLNGESGKCIDIMKKYLFQGHAMDAEHMAKELGMQLGILQLVPVLSVMTWKRFCR